MSSQPRAWSIGGQWGRRGGGGSGDRECPGAPPTSPPPILSMQMLFICVSKLNSRRRRPESAISGSALLHFPGAQRPQSTMSQLENHRRLTPSQFGVVTSWIGGAAGAQSFQQFSTRVTPLWCVVAHKHIQCGHVADPSICAYTPLLKVQHHSLRCSK